MKPNRLPWVRGVAAFCLLSAVGFGVSGEEICGLSNVT